MSQIFSWGVQNKYIAFLCKIWFESFALQCITYACTNSFWNFKMLDYWYGLRLQIVFMICHLCIHYFFLGFWQNFLLISIVEYLFKEGIYLLSDIQLSFFQISALFSFFAIVTLHNDICTCWIKFTHRNKIM